MKKTLSFLTFAVLSAASPAYASSSTYECKPFRNQEGSPTDSGLPESFRLTVRGPEANPEIRITINGRSAKLKANPWTRHTINSDTFDRYTAAGTSGVLIAKNAYALPDHFTAKLDYDVDYYHGVNGWYGYNCR